MAEMMKIQSNTIRILYDDSHRGRERDILLQNLIIYFNLAFCWNDQPGNGPQQHCFARPVFAKKPVNFSFFKRIGNIFQDEIVFEFFAYIYKLDHGIPPI